MSNEIIHRFAPRECRKDKNKSKRYGFLIKTFRNDRTAEHGAGLPEIAALISFARSGG